MGKQKFKVGELVYTMAKFDPNSSELPPNESIIGPEPDTKLIEGIRQDGMLIPLLCTLWEDYLYLIDGGRRLKVARLLELPEVNAQVFENIDPNDQKAIALIVNSQRSVNLVIEYEYLAELRDNDLKAFLKKTRLDNAHVKKVMTLDQLHEDHKNVFVEAYKAGKIAPTTLFGIAKKSKPRQEYLATILEEKGKVTGTDVKKAQQASTTAVLAAADFLSEEVPTIEEEVPENLFAVLNLAEGNQDCNFFDNWNEAFDYSLETKRKMYRLVEV